MILKLHILGDRALYELSDCSTGRVTKVGSGLPQSWLCLLVRIQLYRTTRHNYTVIARRHLAAAVFLSISFLLLSLERVAEVSERRCVLFGFCALARQPQHFKPSVYAAFVVERATPSFVVVFPLNCIVLTAADLGARQVLLEGSFAAIFGHLNDKWQLDNFLLLRHFLRCLLRLDLLKRLFLRCHRV